MDNVLSYANLLKSIKEFKSSGTNTGEKFNRLDFPSHKYFKIMFYFYGDSDTRFDSGLLHPSWIDHVKETEDPIELTRDEKNQRRKDIREDKKKLRATNLNRKTQKNIIDRKYNLNNTESDAYTAEQLLYKYRSIDSAYNFLMNNDETYRADLLKQFINLLSNINCYSPWYFSKLTGLGDAIERKMFTEGKFEIPERGTLTINCLPDAFDNRIGMLLDMYRTIAYSWELKKEILPSNLRKFDMAVFVFESAVDGWNEDSNIGSKGEDGFMTSYKMFEFHDCEFNYNSTKSAYGEIDNTNGFSPTYNIEIFYNSCHEVSYNEHTAKLLGDLITADIQQMIYDDLANDLPTEKPYTEASDFVYIENISKFDSIADHNKELSKRYSGKKSNILTQLVKMGTTAVKDKIKSAILGNLYSYSLTKIADQAKALLQGDFIGAAQAINQYVKNADQARSVMKDHKQKKNIMLEAQEKLQEFADNRRHNIEQRTLYKEEKLRESLDKQKEKLERKNLIEENRARRQATMELAKQEAKDSKEYLKDLKKAIKTEKDNMKKNNKTTLGSMMENDKELSKKEAKNALKQLYVESLTKEKSKTGLSNLHSDTIANN
jgi:hypothetical protein